MCVRIHTLIHWIISWLGMRGANAIAAILNLYVNGFERSIDSSCAFQLFWNYFNVNRLRTVITGEGDFVGTGLNYICCLANWLCQDATYSIINCRCQFLSGSIWIHDRDLSLRRLSCPPSTQHMLHLIDQFEWDQTEGKYLAHMIYDAALFHLK